LGRYPRLRHLWADGGYAGPLKDWAPELGNWILEIVRRDHGTQGFAVLPRRWVVERTFAWLSRNRRLSKDDEEGAKTSESLVFLAMTALMLRRLAPNEPLITQALMRLRAARRSARGAPMSAAALFYRELKAQG
jgi:putative transposase